MGAIADQIDHDVTALKQSLTHWLPTDRDGYTVAYSQRDGTLYHLRIHGSDQTPFSTAIDEAKLRARLREALCASPNLHVHREAVQYVEDARRHLGLVNG